MLVKPIVFDDAAIRDILTGKKRHTRRIVKADNWILLNAIQATYRHPSRQADWKKALAACPWGPKGSVFFIQETYKLHEGQIQYRSDKSVADIHTRLAQAISEEFLKTTWRPARLMPLLFSRLKLTVGKKLRLIKAEANTADDYVKSWAKRSPRWCRTELPILPDSLVWLFEFNFNIEKWLINERNVEKHTEL